MRRLFAFVLQLTLPLSAGTLTYRNAVLADNPIAYWEMDEAAGATTAADSAGTLQAGTYQNVTMGQASAFPNLGTCGQFNGATSRVQVLANAVFELGTGDFSVETWARTPVTSRGDVFNFKNANDFGILFNQNGAGSISGWHNGQLLSWTGAVDAWHHVVMTRAAGTLRLYVNGVERGSQADTQSFSANANLYIGGNHSGAPGYAMATPFHGWIDEVAVYGTALSAARVLDHYNAAQAAPAGAPAVTNSAAANISIFWANLKGQVTSTGIAAPDVTVHWGTEDGGTNAAKWSHAVSLGIQSGAFAKMVTGLAPSTTYYYRARAVNAGGTVWAPETATFTTPATSALEVVINEIHCDHEDKTLRCEFIELYNPGASAVDLTGWAFTRGVDYAFPANTMLNAGAYLVVAENPATVQRTYSYAGALGPWSGSLQQDGETIRLENPAGETADEVDYGLGFPWPTVGVAPNYSHELIHPSLDNSLGGNWRSRGSAVTTTETELVLVAPASTAWRMRRGCFAAPEADWIQPAHTEDTLWENAVTTFNAGTGFHWGIGYGDNDDATSLAAPFPPAPPGIIAMRGGYRSLYLRQTFNVPAVEIRGNLRLRVYADDAAVVYLNGVEVPQRFGVSAGTVMHNAAGGATLSAFEAAPDNWRELTIHNMAAWINPGTNVIAVHGLNESLNGSDFSLNVELRRVSGPAGGSPTPGAANSIFTTTVPPAMRQVEHAPVTPLANQQNILPGQSVRVSVKATDPEGVQSVRLLYQIVEPGAYIKREDAAYELGANWAALPMLDNGSGADLIAGDFVFTADIPASVQKHRRLVRYRIQATDTANHAIRVPYADDPAPNFAYFVYGTMPDYVGAINPALAASYTGGFIPSHTSTPVRYPASMLQQLASYHLITTRQNHVDAQYIPGAPGAGDPTSQFRGDESPGSSDEAAYPWRGTLVYDGKVYDHVRFRARGGVWRYSMGKNMWKFDMMRGHDFQARDNYGRAYDEPWKKVNFSACIQQGNFNHRGEQGLFESVGFRLFQLTGMPANNTQFVHFRIIERASETNGTPDQYDDDFQGLYLGIEQEDGQFLKEHGLPDGNLYKMEGGTGELNNQGPYQPGNKSDLNTFLAYGTTESWWRTNAVLPQYYNYRAIVDCIHHYDIAFGKNYFYYHYPVDPLDPNSNKWQQAAWDLDLTWADTMYPGGNGIAGITSPGSSEPFFSHVWPIPPLRTEMRNRHREVLDLLWNHEQTGMLMDEYASFIYQPGVPSMSGADRAMWDYNPIMVSSFINGDKAGHGRFYQSAVDDPSTAGVNETLTFPGQMQQMRNYITTRRNTITAEILGDEAQVPATPTVVRAGGGTVFPTNDLTFTCSSYSSPSGRPFAKMKWRIAEITNPSAPGYNRWARTAPRQYEIDPDNTWESPEITSFDPNFTFPAASAHVGRTYRVRVKFADSGDAANSNTPRWSHWSAPVTFTAGAPDVSLYLSNLVISEFMYHPREPSGPELNVSANKDDYEYIVVMNAGPQPLDMANIRFTKGIDFDFSGSAVAKLPPGQRAVVVKNAAAFNARYGTRPGGATVAGVWAAGDNLRNSGEQIKLSFGAGVTIRDFTYDDTAPWPAGADGDGYALVLVAPWTIPNHALPENWRLSTGLDGGAGQYDSQRFTGWKSAHGITGDLDDGDQDGLSALLEFALLGDPSLASQSVLPAGSLTDFGDDRYLTLTVRVNRGADDVIFIPERSTDLGSWDSSPGAVVPVSAVPDAGGGNTLQWRSAIPRSDAVCEEYLRLRVVLR